MDAKSRRLATVGESRRSLSPYFVCEKDAGEEFTCLILQDEEGNGPGSLSHSGLPLYYYGEDGVNAAMRRTFTSDAPFGANNNNVFP